MDGSVMTPQTIDWITSGLSVHDKSNAWAGPDHWKYRKQRGEQDIISCVLCQDLKHSSLCCYMDRILGIINRQTFRDNVEHTSCIQITGSQEVLVLFIETPAFESVQMLIPPWRMEDWKIQQLQKPRGRSANLLFWTSKIPQKLICLLLNPLLIPDVLFW